MPRRTIATLAGVLGFLAYVTGVVTYADAVTAASWPLQVLYFLVAGIAWVVPARWLILWAARG